MGWIRMIRISRQKKSILWRSHLKESYFTYNCSITKIHSTNSSALELACNSPTSSWMYITLSHAGTDASQVLSG